MLELNFDPFPELITDRILLRRLTLADAPCLKHLRSNVDVMRYINRPLTQTIEEAETWIKVILEALEKNDGITWCMCLKETPHVLVGSIGLWRVEKHNYRAEVGYMLEPSLQGRGLMFEALQKVLEYGFGSMKLHSIEAQINPANKASAALLEKSGFVQEGYFRENHCVQGTFADTAIYSLLNPSRSRKREASETTGDALAVGLQ